MVGKVWAIKNSIKRNMEGLMKDNKCIKTNIEGLIKKWEDEGGFLDNKGDHPSDRSSGKVYKECALELKELLRP